METFSALLALCAMNSPVTCEFPSQRPVTRSFDVFFDLCLNKRLSKQLRRRWFETPSRSLWCHCNWPHCSKLKGPAIFSDQFATDVKANGLIQLWRGYFNVSGPFSLKLFMLKFTLFNKDFQTCLLVDWTAQPPPNHSDDFELHGPWVFTWIFRIISVPWSSCMSCIYRTVNCTIRRLHWFVITFILGQFWPMCTFIYKACKSYYCCIVIIFILFYYDYMYNVFIMVTF